MIKVLVDPAALEEAAKWLEIHSSSSGSAEAFAADALREAIAQTAEAEVVSVVGVVCISHFKNNPAMENVEFHLAADLPQGQHEVILHSSHLAALSAVTAERDRLLSENARLIEDRARFPDRPDDIGHMIGSHIGNLKAGKVQAEKYARKWRDNLDSEIRAVDQLRAEVDALRKDAERYRWLRDPCSGAEHVIYYSRGDYGRGLMSGSMLDAAIDAAMAAKEA